MFSLALISAAMVPGAVAVTDIRFHDVCKDGVFLRKSQFTYRYRTRRQRRCIRHAVRLFDDHSDIEFIQNQEYFKKHLQKLRERNWKCVGFGIKEPTPIGDTNDQHTSCEFEDLTGCAFVTRTGNDGCTYIKWLDKNGLDTDVQARLNRSSFVAGTDGIKYGNYEDAEVSQPRLEIPVHFIGDWQTEEWRISKNIESARRSWCGRLPVQPARITPKSLKPYFSGTGTKGYLKIFFEDDDQRTIFEDRLMKDTNLRFEKRRVNESVGTNMRKLSPKPRPQQQYFDFSREESTKIMFNPDDQVEILQGHPHAGSRGKLIEESQSHVWIVQLDDKSEIEVHEENMRVIIQPRRRKKERGGKKYLERMVYDDVDIMDTLHERDEESSEPQMSNHSQRVSVQRRFRKYYQQSRSGPETFTPTRKTDDGFPTSNRRIGGTRSRSKRAKKHQKALEKERKLADQLSRVRSKKVQGHYNADEIFGKDGKNMIDECNDPEYYDKYDMSDAADEGIQNACDMLIAYFIGLGLIGALLAHLNV